MTTLVEEKGPAEAATSPSHGSVSPLAKTSANGVEDNSNAGLTASASHQIDYPALRALPTEDLAAMWTALTEASSVLIGHLNSPRFSRPESILYGPAGDVLDEVVDHLRTMRDAVLMAAEERRPRDAREAEERGRLLLLDAVTNGASWEEIADLAERAPYERAGLL